jgi:hypothetical protein
MRQFADHWTATMKFRRALFLIATLLPLAGCPELADQVPEGGHNNGDGDGEGEGRSGIGNGGGYGS